MTGVGIGTPLGSRGNRFREFCHRVYQKSAEDDVFFMAGAISYNLLIAVVPIFLLVVGLWDTRYVPATGTRPRSLCSCSRTTFRPGAETST